VSANPRLSRHNWLIKFKYEVIFFSIERETKVIRRIDVSQNSSTISEEQYRYPYSLTPSQKCKSQRAIITNIQRSGEPRSRSVRMYKSSFVERKSCHQTKLSPGCGISMMQIHGPICEYPQFAILTGAANEGSSRTLLEAQPQTTRRVESQVASLSM
jgi:hypothetical protein